MDSYFKNNIVVREFLSKEEIDLWNQNSQSYLTNTAFINHFEGLNKEETKPIYISHPKGHLFGHIIKLSGGAMYQEVSPGTYNISLFKIEGTTMSFLGGPVSLEVERIRSNILTNPLADQHESYYMNLASFTKEVRT